MKLRRLLWADMTDVASRGWQELWRSFDRAAVASLPASCWVPPFFWHLRPQPVDVGAEAGRDSADARLGAFRRGAVARFFAGAGDPRLPALLAAGLPEHRSLILAAADALRERSFSLLGHRALFLDEPIDWHRDVVSGRKAPFVHWSRIDPLDQENVGDSKVTWELNRHQWLVTLGQAYRMSGDERYAEVFASSVRDWMEANPPGMGINWASSLEVSYRMISWCWALNLFRDAAVLTPRLYADMLGWLYSHAAHVEKYLSHYFSPNTHLTGEALGLFYAGMLFPELPRARRWRTLGARILQRELPRQVLPDGVYFEQSTCYGRYTAEIYLHFLILAKRNGIAVPVSVAERVQWLLDHLLAVCRPDGSLPQIGDADGGRLLPLARRAADDCRDVFAVAAAFFKRADYAWAARGPAAETAWLLGPTGCDAFDALEPAPPQWLPSRLFQVGGCAVMQGGWERDAHQLLLDAGPLGCRVSGGHGHADLLSIQCSVFGRPQLVDPGTYCYTAHLNWRDHFRGSAAHNTVVIDRKSQAVSNGPFSWRRRPQAQLRRWISSPSFDYAEADHDAYRRLPDPVRHRRRVLFVKPRYWVVVDDLLGDDVHQVDLSFQFRPGALAEAGDGWMRATGPEGRGLLVRAFAATPLQVETHEGCVEPIRGWMSPDYGLRVPAPQLVYTALEQLPLRIVTLLVPLDDGVPPPQAILVPATDGVNLMFGDAQETIRVGDRQITVACTGRPDIVPLDAE